MDSTSPDNPIAIRQRARLLMDQRRHVDAAEWWQRLLAMDPEDAMALAQLAICWVQTPGKETQALEAARHAIRLEPDESYFHAVLSMTLLDSAKPGQDAQVRESLASAQKAVELDADSSFAHSLIAMALLRLKKFAEAEHAARHALALDTTNTMAAQVLSMALLNQKKDGDLNSLVDWQLQEKPDDDSAHVSAGYRDLMQGRHKEACNHFREALRLDPSNEGARHGLIESFRARSWFYRMYLRFAYFMAQFGQRGAGGIMLAGFVFYRVAFGLLEKNYPAIAYTLAGAWMVFALWTFLARGLGSALMLTDSFVRLAITRKEKWEGLCVGGLVLTALVALGFGLWMHQFAFLLVAMACALSAVPVASAFSNEHHTGRWLYLGLAILSGGAAMCFTLGLLLNLGLLANLTTFKVATYTGAACTWMRMLGVMYR